MRQDGGVQSAEAAELERLARMRAKARRQPIILICVFNALICAVAATAVVDLRRLQTPSGTGMRWLQASLYGDCEDYLTYSVADPSYPDHRTHDQLCRDLRSASATAQSDAVRVGLSLRLVAQDTVDTVQGQLTRKGVTRTFRMHVVRRQGHWRVLRDQLTCSSVGCA